MSEYLAAMKVVQDRAQYVDRWSHFLEEVANKPGAPQAIRGFLLALRDCCEALPTDRPVPEFVTIELARQLALDQTNLALRASSAGSANTSSA